jgi:serine/threonine-protein kinase
MSQLPSEPPPSTGLIDGKYQLVRLIGRGGMGSVWEARHASLGTPSAIKFIESEYADSQEARSRFIREAKAAATIQSKHAIQIYDHGVTDDGKPYIVMELLQGEPLDKRIERQGALTLQETARILQQVCRGLQRAHERGIVHRDLKPENIFLVKTPDDDDETAKVLDFGIAKISGAGSPSGVTSSTKTGAVLGTPFYMSPEQARGLKSVDHRTDVWSLGVIAYKCLTGKLPFDGESVGDLLVKICTAPVPLPSHSVPGLPPAFDTWFLRALEREPERRFATVNELAEHLVYAAGIGARGASASQVQFSGYDTVATSQAGQAGQAGQGGHIGTPAPAMRSQMGAPSYTAPTPAPGGMTAAPFTSEPIAGVPTASRWKWIVGAAFLGLAVAGLGTGIAVAMKKRDTTSSNSVGITPAPPPPASDKPEDLPNANASANPSPTAPHTDSPTTPPLKPLDPPPQAPVAAGPAKGIAPAKPGVHTKPGATPPPPTKPGPGTVTAPPPPGPQPVPLPPVVAQPPPPTPPPPAPAPAKKPNKSDPGY